MTDLRLGTGRAAQGSARAHTVDADDIPWRGIGAGLAALALVGGGLWINAAVDAQRPRGTDTEQIRHLLQTAEQAAERGDSAALGRLVSDDYRDEVGFSDTSVRYQIRDYLRTHRFAEVTIPSRALQISVGPDGKTATATFPVMLQIQRRDEAGSVQLTLSLTLHKDPVHYFYVFPGAEWRITRTEGYMPLAE